VENFAQLDEQMALLAEGDRSAIEVLFRGLWPLVHHYCEQMLGGGPEADDAAQAAMEKVFTEAARYDRALHAVPWALAIALWECRTVHRRRQRARTAPLEMAAGARSAGPSPEDATIERDLLDRAHAVLDQLSPSDRAVLQATFAQDTTIPTAISGSAFRKRRERALGRLRQAWEKLHGR